MRTSIRLSILLLVLISSIQPLTAAPRPLDQLAGTGRINSVSVEDWRITIDGDPYVLPASVRVAGPGDTILGAGQLQVGMKVRFVLSIPPHGETPGVISEVRIVTQ